MVYSARDEKLEIPLAFCDTCNEKVPVVLLNYTFNDQIEPALEGETIQFIYCPLCERLLNTLENIAVEWYDQEEIPKVTNFKIKEQEDEQKES